MWLVLDVRDANVDIFVMFENDLHCCFKETCIPTLQCHRQYYFANRPNMVLIIVSLTEDYEAVCTSIVL